MDSSPESREADLDDDFLAELRTVDEGEPPVQTRPGHLVETQVRSPLIRSRWHDLRWLLASWPAKVGAIVVILALAAAGYGIYHLARVTAAEAQARQEQQIAQEHADQITEAKDELKALAADAQALLDATSGAVAPEDSTRDDLRESIAAANTILGLGTAGEDLDVLSGAADGLDATMADVRAAELAFAVEVLGGSITTAQQTILDSDGKVNDPALRDTLHLAVVQATEVHTAADDLQAVRDQTTALGSAREAVLTDQAAWQATEDARLAAEAEAARLAAEQAAAAEAERQAQQPTPTQAPSRTSSPSAAPTQVPAPAPTRTQAPSVGRASTTRTASCSGSVSVRWTASGGGTVTLSGAASGSGSGSVSATSGGGTVTATADGTVSLNYSWSSPDGSGSCS